MINSAIYGVTVVRHVATLMAGYAGGHKALPLRATAAFVMISIFGFLSKSSLGSVTSRFFRTLCRRALAVELLAILPSIRLARSLC